MKKSIISTLVLAFSLTIVAEPQPEKQPESEKTIIETLFGIKVCDRFPSCSDDDKSDEKQKSLDNLDIKEEDKVS